MAFSHDVSLFALVCCLLVASSFAQDKGAGFVCAKECHEQQCDNFGIRYGKYCGVGHGGCPGEKPCDAVDACCELHDSCVDKVGVLEAQDCHNKFITCLNKQEKTGKNGFSDTCPWNLVIPAMRQGIEMASMFTNMFNNGAANAANGAANAFGKVADAAASGQGRHRHQRNEIEDE